MTPVAIAADATEYLGPGDTVKISVFQNPDLSTETRVSALCPADRRRDRRLGVAA